MTKVFKFENATITVIVHEAGDNTTPPEPPPYGTLTLGVFSPWNPSLTPPGNDFNMWGSFVGLPASSLVNMGMGIAQQGDWANYEGSAYSVCEAWKTINAGEPLPDGQNEINIGPFPDSVGGTLSQAATGAYTAHWQAVAQQFVNYGFTKVRFRPCWEFEGGWYPWGYNSGSQNRNTYVADYIATYRLMVSTIRAIMPDARFIWCAADGQTMNSPTWESCYPGDDVVDEIGIDVYCANGRDEDVSDPATLWNNEAAPGIERSQALATARQKDWGVYETAVGSGALPDNPAWIESMAGACAAFQATGGNAHLGYWSAPYGSGDGGLGGHPQSFAQYQKPRPQGFHV